MRIAHLAFDQKFIPFAQDVFEDAFPEGNSWFLLHAKRAPLRYVSNLHNVELVSRRGLWDSTCIGRIGKHEMVVVHAMIPEFAEVVKRLSADTVVLWFGWGYEYYAYLERVFGPVILPDTAAAWKRSVAADRAVPDGLMRRLKSVPRKVLRTLVSAARHKPGETIQTVAGRIDLCSVSPSEMPLLKAAFPHFRAKHYQLHYFSREDILDQGPSQMAGPDILLGNSATPENNHVEAMALLKRVPLDGRRIIAPLSYGPPHYADEICRLGFDSFGPRFTPLRDYLPVDKYFQLLSTCGTVVMNHRRQAAMGNISAALYKGSRVVLREENPIYATYAGLGALLDPMSRIEANPSAIIQPLTALERQKNREVVGAYMSRSNLVRAIQGLAAYYGAARPLASAQAERAA
jgi:hypothetical protein